MRGCVGRHFGKHIPGNPTVVVQNIPGSGSNKAASYVALQAPKDGTAIGAIQPGAVLQPLHSDVKLPHDPSKFIMLGSASSGVYLCLVRSDAPVKTFEETFSKEVLIGTPGEGATLARDADPAGQRAGREAPADRRLCRHRTRSCSRWSATKSTACAAWAGRASRCSAANGSATARCAPSCRRTCNGHPELNKMGVPLAISFAKTEEDRQVMEMIYSQNLFGRPYVLPEGVPAGPRRGVAQGVHGHDERPGAGGGSRTRPAWSSASATARRCRRW